MDFLTKTKFSRKIQDEVTKKRLTYMDAVLHICEENNIDPSDVKKYISRPIKEKIEAEARNLHFLPVGENELPIS